MDNVQKSDVIDALSLFKNAADNLYTTKSGSMNPIIRVTTLNNTTVTATNGVDSFSATTSNDDDNATVDIAVNSYGDWFISINGASAKIVSIDAVKIYEIDIFPIRYGYRIRKDESDPYARVEYLYDAVGMTPAKMNFSTGKFDYGSWADIWFVKDNKPLMLKSNGTVDYYLNPNDYSKKEDGTASDISNADYDGNAMAQIPLCWVKRYEDDNYLYEIVSNIQIDDTYKAYAHTDKNGNIKPYCYHSLFGGSLISDKIRSISGQALANYIKMPSMVGGATNNGNGWYIDYWSQYQLIRTLLVLIGKSTNTQAVFGNGNQSRSLLTTGTLNNKGQFCGFNDDNHQVKVFHMEGLWGDQWLSTAGIINSGGKIYAKMTPEGDGYRISDANGYVDTGISLPSANNNWISAMSCTEYGLIPKAVSGSSSTYFCDIMWNNGGWSLVGAGAGNSSGSAGIFAYTDGQPSASDMWMGCALTYV